MHRLSFMVAVTTLLTGLLLTRAPAIAAGETCQGRPATIVGVGPDVVGTPGNDVIVTGMSRNTRADEGDDLICVTYPALGGIYIDAGGGDDVVDASSTTGTNSVVLGSGRDRYLGGRGEDDVRGDGADDDVYGGGGEDRVTIDATAGTVTNLGRYDGGSGVNLISVLSEAMDVEVQLDRQIIIGGTPAAGLVHFDNAGVAAPRAVLRGNADDNTLAYAGCEARVSGARGDDVLLPGYLTEHVPTFPCDREARLSGGRGSDAIRGSKGPDRILGGAGNDLLEGRRGADRLVGGTGVDDLAGSEGTDVLLGSGGDDTIRGGPGNDVLRGGSGGDSADGSDGLDICFAERERRCER